MHYPELFLSFFKIGLFTFGGGYAMIPLIGSEVEKHGWMQPSDLVDFVAVSESTPGAFAVNVSTYVGERVAGLPGAFFATLGVVLPSFVVILVIAKFFVKYRGGKIVSGFMSGLNPAVVGLIGAAAVSVGRTVFFPNGLCAAALSSPFLLTLAIFALSLFLILKGRSPILVIVISAAIGLAAGFAPF
jgi:chromate transporter